MASINPSPPSKVASQTAANCWKEHLGHLRAKKAAAERLARLREQYSKAATERNVWRERVRDAIEVDLYDLAALRTVSEALRDIAVQLHHHLAIAGIYQLSSTESSSVSISQS